MTDQPSPARAGLAGRLAAAFVDSKLTPLVLVGSVLLGVGAVVLLPREEEPQIKVPMVDLSVGMPGASAEEVEQRVSSPLERLMWEISGVEYVYSTSSPGRSLVVVQFKVGQDIDRSLVKLQQKLDANRDRIPAGVSAPLIKLRSIDDVPILALTFHSEREDALAIRRVAAEVAARIKRRPDVAEIRVIGGQRRAVRVVLDPSALSARSLAPSDVTAALLQANEQRNAGAMTSGGDIVVQTGGFFHDARDVGNAVVGVHNGLPVSVRDVAQVSDASQEPSQYVLFGQGAATAKDAPIEAAVTLSIAKRPGTNAITVARDVLQVVSELRGTVIPRDIAVTTTRHYGQTANEKSSELLLHMGIAVISVSLLILFMLGFRESLVVAVAIPSTLALTLLVFYLGGYTLNRITLFALIFSIGILVDDAIVVVENIVRHRDLAAHRGEGLTSIAVRAVAEVGNPTVLATLAVIAAILPMAFVSGLMGPYMRPIPVGGSAAMLFSLLVAFTVTPWAAVRILRQRPQRGHGEHHEDRFSRAYRRVMASLLGRRGVRFAFLGAIVALLLLAMALVPLGVVHVKMLPFDNKSELQIILNMPEGSALEQTARVAREMADAVRKEPEVVDYQLYIGTAAPFNFNGLVRHYDMRAGASSADVQVNFLPKHERSAQSHEIAKRIRPAVAAIAARYGARVAVAEVPPGPPVLQTLVAEIYGPSPDARLRLASAVKERLRKTPNVVDIDWYVEDAHPKLRLQVDKEKAALHGITADAVAANVQIAIAGSAAGLLHVPREREDVPIWVDLPRSARSRIDDLLGLNLRGQGTALIPLRELVRVESTTEDRSIYHKNLLPVVYVTADMAGSVESSAYAIFDVNRSLKSLDASAFGGDQGAIRIWNASMPESDSQPAIKWDGEWHITLEVFRDLGVAFSVVLVLIYMLLVGWFRSFSKPLVVMAAIPFSLVGILPAHAAASAYFTATSMIGFMAGAGIVVRNSIILVDFIEARLAEGMPVHDAVIEAGAVRFRPMLLTAAAVVVGAAVILADPIFQGLAIALMAGELASLAISRMAVPVLYAMLAGRRDSATKSAAAETMNGAISPAAPSGNIEPQRAPA